MCADCQNVVPPPTRSLSSATFSRPPLDMSLNLPELVEWHETHSALHPVFAYPVSGGHVEVLRWFEVALLVRHEARRLRTLLESKAVTQGFHIVALVINCDTVTYFRTLIGLARAGFTGFPMSPRNSPAAIAHLCNKVGVTHVIRGSEPGLVSLVSEAVELLKASSTTISLPSVSELPPFTHPRDLSATDLPYQRRSINEVQLYVHSSGSTGFPKPIPWTYRQILQLGYVCHFGERDLTGKVLAIHGVPVYHGLGMMQIGWAATTGIVLSVFEPRSPAIYPTPENHFDALSFTRSDLVLAVPSMIEAWSRDASKVRQLRELMGVIYGGGPLNKEVGDSLVSEGVAVYPLYGSSECGTVNVIIPADRNSDWEYFRFASNTTVEMVPSGDGYFEFVMLCNSYNSLRVTNTTIRGRPAYATSDLFEKHPSKPGYWKVYGRKDDQIMHSSGEKTNPGPIESLLGADPLIRSAVVFGCGQLQAGVLIDPITPFDPKNGEELTGFLDSVAPTVQRVNAVVPRHSRILRDMILVSDPGKTFQYTAKGTPRRQIILKDYQAEVAALYKGQKSTPNFDREPAETWDFQSILELVRSVVRKALDTEILSDDIDLFQHGLDSFHATCVRHALLHNLPSFPQIDHDNAIENFVYRYPTITKLARFLNRSVAGLDTAMSVVPVESKIGAMKAMVKVHGRDFLCAPAKVRSGVSSSQMLNNHDEARVVLITGTTGTLGSHLLLELTQDPRVRTIYALNRARRGGKAALVAKQITALSDLGIDGQALLTSERIVLLEADLSATQFGLSPETFEEMTISVTHIVHNAWPVHFNLSLESFEPSIRDLRCLIDFVLASPRVDKPKFIFTSTIGVFRGSPTHGEFLEESIPPQVAVGMGYSESKWVAEEILLEAVRAANLPALIVRVGQLTSSNGNIWKVGEWFPTLVQGSVLLGCLPQLVGTISWLPVKDAAQVIKECMDHPWQDPIVHLVHPTPVSWEVIESSLSHQLNLPVAEYQDWLARLEALEGRCHADGTMPSKAMARVSSLAPFFKHGRMLCSPTTFPFISLANAAKLSSKLRNREVQPLSSEDVAGWITCWRKSGGLVSASEA
ncbi:CurK protein [Coprinopsis cinerea AmutBmut pab1-1]|nr:CurK protein [Coprinopsis cinerea AmutBmut pab1-1]